MRDLRGERELKVERRENFDGWEREREREREFRWQKYINNNNNKKRIWVFK